MVLNENGLMKENVILKLFPYPKRQLAQLLNNALNLVSNRYLSFEAYNQSLKILIQVD